MEILRPYDVDLFNRLPCLEDSDHQFQVNNGPVVVTHTLQDLFLRLKKNQALVDTNGSSTPWCLPRPTNPINGVFQKYGGYVTPRSWLLSDNKLVPYEFQFDNLRSEEAGEQGTSPTQFDSNFIEEFASILLLHNLTTVLGLCLLKAPGQRLIEVTEGNTNVTFPVHEGTTPTAAKLVETSWEYEVTSSKDGPSTRVTCHPTTKCISDGDGTHTTVDGRHIPENDDENEEE